MKNTMNWTLIRIVILVSGTLIGSLGLFLGYLLMRQGATGKFEILGEGKGFQMFVTSLSPGVFLALVGCVVSSLAILVQRKCLGMPDPKQLRERKGAAYFEDPNQTAANQPIHTDSAQPAASRPPVPNG